MADNSVHMQMKARRGASITINIGGDATSYRGTLQDIHPISEPTSDGGADASQSDVVMIIVRLGRTKS